MICNAVVVRQAAHVRGVAALVAVVALAALAACRDDAQPRVPSATVPTAPATTTTTHPYAVPAVIDAEYVNRVITGLDAIMGDATRLVVQTKTTSQEVFDRLRAVYANDADVDLRLKDYALQVSKGLPSARQQPGDKRTTVSELISNSSNCPYVRVDRDYSPVILNSSGTTKMDSPPASR